MRLQFIFLDFNPYMKNHVASPQATFDREDISWLFHSIRRHVQKYYTYLRKKNSKRYNLKITHKLPGNSY